MPLPKNRSTSVRKLVRRTPKGGATARYVRRIKGKAHACALCAGRLQAVSSVRSSPTRPNRRFGGNLCTACASRVIVLASRVAEGSLKESEVQIRALPYVRRLNSAKK